jgi:hypothetical protein
MSSNRDCRIDSILARAASGDNVYGTTFAATLLDFAGAFLSFEQACKSFGARSLSVLHNLSITSDKVVNRANRQ